MQVPLIVSIHAVKPQKRGTARRGAVGQRAAGQSQAVQHHACVEEGVHYRRTVIGVTCQTQCELKIRPGLTGGIIDICSSGIRIPSLEIKRVCKLPHAMCKCLPRFSLTGAILRNFNQNLCTGYPEVWGVSLVTE
jgi:hypothetical protein